jgi:hypothetical protein
MRSMSGPSKKIFFRGLEVFFSECGPSKQIFFFWILNEWSTRLSCIEIVKKCKMKLTSKDYMLNVVVLMAL